MNELETDIGRAQQQPQKKMGASAKPPSLEEAMRAEKAGALVMAARMAHRKGRLDETRTLLQQALALSSTDSGALELLGDLFLEEGEQQKAIAVFERGLKYHPEHGVFEEKIGLAKLDLAEVERDKILRRQFLEEGDVESWQDRNPRTSALLSLALPGAGQFYNEEYERGGVFLGAAVATFIAWFWPLNAAIKNARSLGAANLGAGISVGLSSMGGLTKSFVCIMFLAWIAVYVFAARDAARIAIFAAENRKRSIGIWT